MVAQLTFSDVAKNIIKETISSAIFIDDHALENFKAKNSKYKDDNILTIKLFEDFKKNQCLLHPFRFTKKGWGKDKRFYLKNKDLLILDWQLVKEDHSEALKILDYAVIEKSLHFICIYSQENPDAIGNEINGFFLGNTSNELTIQIREFFKDTNLNEFWTLPKTDPEWEEFDTLINSLLNSKKDDLEAQIDEIKDKYELSQEQITFVLQIDQNDVKSSFSKLRTALALEDSNFSKHSKSDFFKKSDFVENTFYIGHTIIKIFPKDITGDKLYDSFLESFLKEQNIFLSLMGLEMRNRFRENSAFIGKDFDNLNENAFFHHKNKNNSNPYIFYDFLREILKDQISSFLYEKDFELFESLSNYYDENDGAKKQADFINVNNKENFIHQTFKLNNFYNRFNNNERLKNDFLRFGDIFKCNRIKKVEGLPDEIEERFYLCVTPHCDCLNPHKMDHQFWFIEGRIETGSVNEKMKILESADGAFVSFVKIEEDIHAILWEKYRTFECKPKTFFVNNHKMVNNKLQVEYNGQKLDFTYIESLKENYTQRLANKAFGYPIRVGIDFVKK